MASNTNKRDAVLDSVLTNMEHGYIISALFYFLLSMLFCISAFTYRSYLNFIATATMSMITAAAANTTSIYALICYCLLCCILDKMHCYEKV
jgi:hypothetical protein